MYSQIFRLALAFLFATICSARFSVRLNSYVNEDRLLPERFTCWNYASDYHGDDCVLNFTLVVSDFQGSIFVQPTVLNYGIIQPQLPENGSVYLEHGSIDFVLSDYQLKGKPSSIAVIAYVRGTNGSGSSQNNYIGHRPITLALMDYFEVSGNDLHKGTYQVSATGQLDDVHSTITLSYNLDYNVEEFGPFGNMSCVSKGNGTYVCGPMQAVPMDGGSTGNYLCTTTSKTFRQEFIQRQQVYYTFLDTEESSCAFCTFGVNALASGCNLPPAGSEEFSRYEKDASWYRTGTIVLGILLGIAILLLLTLCVFIVYLRATYEDGGSSAYKKTLTKRETSTTSAAAPPIRRWDASTFKETKPLVSQEEVIQTTQKEDPNAWQYSPVKATNTITTITYRGQDVIQGGVNSHPNPNISVDNRGLPRLASTQSRSSTASSGQRREAAV